VLILLPPSEGKTAPARGRRLAMSRLSFPELTDTRSRVADALVRLSTGPAAKARTTLGISARQDDELERNKTLLTAPTAPAGDIYTGVLYDALNLAGLDARSRKRAARDIAIASALFGLVRVTDHIPAYRLSGNTTLPGVGRLANTWREPVAEAMRTAAGRGLVLDLRSAAYVALGPVPEDLADRTAIARVFQQKGSKRTIVSHHNKATKGRLVRSLLAEPRPRNIEDLAGALGAAGYRVELAPPASDTKPWTIDVIVDSL
jgi:cytoplasmic iron level regulating protein YaaA (DUF328/UPF0246 family)